MAAFGPMGNSNSPVDHHLSGRWLAVHAANQRSSKTTRVLSAANLGSIQDTSIIKASVILQGDKMDDAVSIGRDS